MKRITTLLLAVMFTIGCVTAAQAQSAVDVKVKGRWDFAFTMVFNSEFNKNGDRNGTVRNDDNFIGGTQRVRTQVNFIMSENLQAVLHFEIGSINWGNNNGNGSVGKGSGGSLSADGVNVETKHAYLDWMVPNTALKIRMGIQGIALPSSNLDSLLLDDDMAGIVASYKFNDMFTLTGFWARPFNANITDPVNRSLNDEVDLFGLVGAISLDGATISPYFMYGNIGSASNFYTSRYTATATTDDSRASAWWLGTALEVDILDPLVFSGEFTYGSIGKNPASYTRIARTFDAQEDLSMRGWYVAATVDYKTSWGIPGIFGWYSSGDNASDVRDSNRLGRMPTVHGDQGFTSFGTDGAFGDGPGTGYLLNESVIGTWGLGIQLADVSFIKKLSHTLRFTYYTGTNDAKIVRDARRASGNTSGMWAGAADYNENMAGIGSGPDRQTPNYLTDKDHAFEINFDHKYRIYDNLRVALELGCISIDRDKNTWGSDFQDETAYKVAVAFEYRF